MLVPDSVLQKTSSWCFDIVDELSFTSACFTKSYGRYIRGTGSILAVPNLSDSKAHETRSNEVASETDKSASAGKTDLISRNYDAAWMSNYPDHRLRYFSDSELMLLFGFPASLVMSDSVPYRKRYELIGNSLNVIVAAEVLKRGGVANAFF